MRVFIIEDEPIMAECLARAVRLVQADDLAIEIFHDAISAMSALSDNLPDLILLDILLKGPDGFTLLNELMSYSDTVQIPVILVTSLDFVDTDLSHYGVVKVLQKDTMTPSEIAYAVAQAFRRDVRSRSNLQRNAYLDAQTHSECSITKKDKDDSRTQRKSLAEKPLEAI